MSNQMAGMDYNGVGEWSADAVIRRYEAYCEQFGLPMRRLLQAKVSGVDYDRRVWPIMGAVNDGIKQDDPACTEIGIDFICESKGFPFGMTLKSQTARALRKATLTPRQLDRIRARLVEMLVSAYLPQEYRFYVRLFRRTGLGTYKQQLLELVPRGFRMERYVNYVHVLAAENPVSPQASLY
jgi:hypothetical protein